MKASFKMISIVLFLSLILAPSVFAQSMMNLRAHLAGRNEIPSVDTLAQGQAIFMINEDEATINYKLIVANIEDVTQAHIHLGGADVNGPVVVFLYGFALIPGRFNGVLAEGTITASNLVGPLVGQPLSVLIDAMRAGNTYVNVHTTLNPGGEVRGQVH